MTEPSADVRWDEIRESGRPAQLKVALLSTFSIDPLVPYLGTSLEDERLPADLLVGPYGQIAQECLSPDGDVSAFSPDVLVVWARWEDVWGKLPLPLSDDPERYLAAILPLAEATRAAVQRLQCTAIFVLPSLPELRPLGVGDAANPLGVAAVATQAREGLRRHLAGVAGIRCFDAEEVIRAIGTDQAYNARMAALARIPYSDAVWALAGQLLARLVRVSRQPARRVLVVDGDNTLWGGVVGEDGAAGVDLRENGPGAAFLELQRYLQELRRSGVLLALSSKNDEADVWAVFARREMRLKKDELAAWRIGWQPKSTSIRQMAEELGLGLDAFAFLDDSPAELAEVQASLPQVACIRMPADPVEWMRAVQGSGLLDRPPPTTEDMQRADYYQQDRQRQEAQEGAASPAEYLAQLGVTASVFPPSASDLQRFTQLINKTNQFNLNGRRRTEAELAAVLSAGRHLSLLVQVSDKFGSYGVVGAAILERGEGEHSLDTFVLSCRAMGRGVEEAMIASLFSHEGVEEIVATVLDLPRNEPARKFFATLGCTELGSPQRLRRVSWPPYVTRE